MPLPDTVITLPDIIVLSAAKDPRDRMPQPPAWILRSAQDNGGENGS